MHVYDIKVLSRPALLNHSTLLFPLHIASADLVPRNADSKPHRCIAMIIQTNPTQKGRVQVHTAQILPQLKKTCSSTW